MTTPPITVPAIAFDSATKRYATSKAPATTILESITTQVQRREFVSIIGPSGCGKSTLLKMVAGLTPVTTGNISIHGMTPQKARELVSFIFFSIKFFHFGWFLLASDSLGQIHIFIQII